MPTTRKTSRIAVVVSKKTAKTAVARTRIRRKVYEIIRTEVLGGFSGSWDAILTVFNAGLAEMPHEELKRKVKALLKTLMT
jgi:ribonuclease P protein component